MHQSSEVENAGNGGNVNSNGYKNNRYWLIPTNKGISDDYSHASDSAYQFEHLYNNVGGKASADGGGGGGASNFTNGGNGGGYSSTAGTDGTLGSGGGGA